MLNIENHKKMNLQNTRIKSGKEVIEDFFAEIYNIPNTNKKTIETLVSLFNEKKFTEKSIQNALDEQLQKELNKIEKGND